MDTLKQMFKSNIRQYGMLIALIVIVVFFHIASGGVLLRPLNITNVILQNGYILIMAIGMLLVIVAFQIDLSIGSVVAFIGALAGIFMVTYKMSVVVSVALCLLIGIAVGAFQGWWIAYVKIPAFITTLAGMLIFRGFTMTLLNGRTLAPFPTSFQKISTGFIPDFFGGKGIHITSILIGILFSIVYIIIELNSRRTQKRYNFEVIPTGFLIAKMVLIIAFINAFIYELAIYKGIPYNLVLVFVLIVVYTFVTDKTVIGRHIYALGGNEKAAKLSGVKTQSLTFWVFVNMGFLSALAGLAFAARLNAATPQAGNGFELNAIAACFIGGASTAGGIGTVMGAIIGGLVVGVMNNGMSLMGIGIDMQQSIRGFVLLLAVAFDIYSKSKAS